MEFPNPQARCAPPRALFALTFFMLSLLAFPAVLWAGVTGSISGTVRDARCGGTH